MTACRVSGIVICRKCVLIGGKTLGFAGLRDWHAVRGLSGRVEQAGSVLLVAAAADVVSCGVGCGEQTVRFSAANRMPQRNGCPMRSRVLLAVCLTTILGCRAMHCAAADPLRGVTRSDAAVRGPVQRTVFGLPLPQQWTNGRPPGFSRSYRPVVSAGQSCADGRCATGCANGQCQVGCPNGRCGASSRLVPGSQVRGGNCAGGVCRPVGGGGAVRSQPADPFRRRAADSAEPEWLTRPVTAPLQEAFGSDYDRQRLDLRSEYFRGGRGVSGSPAGVGVPDRQSRGIAGPRSLEVPAELRGAQQTL